MGQERCTVLVRLAEGDHFEVLDVDGLIIFKWIVKKSDGMAWT
jgi:hypothetical protein